MASPFDVTALDDYDLAVLIATALDEQRQRALDAADTDALIELGFQEGFRRDGLPRDPFIRSGIIICPGTRIDRSATSHDCGFVTIDEDWVWESPLVVEDVIRHVPGPKATMRSISLVAATEGLELSMVQSRARTGVHQLREARTFVVSGSDLTHTATRAPKRTDHRR